MADLANKTKQIWRIASLALLILALIGPWTYDVIYVPAEYTCQPPNIRLEGDFCGLPMSGMRVIFFLLEAFISISIGFMNGTAVFADRAREYLFTIFFLLPVLPFISTLVMFWKKESRRLQAIHLITWGLAAIMGLVWSLFVFSDPHPQKWRLWGVWFYLILTISMLTLETFALATKKGTVQRVFK